MKNYKTISLLALLTLGFASCTNFFEREPFSQVGADTFFRSEKDVVLYVNGLLQKNMPGYTTLTYGDQYSDLMAVNSTSDFLKTAWSAEKQRPATGPISTTSTISFRVSTRRLPPWVTTPG